MSVPVTASGAGPGTVTVKVSGAGQFALERSYALDVRPATQILTRRTVRTLAKGETPHVVERSVRRFRAGYRPRRLCRLPSQRRSTPRRLLSALDRYPFGCSEQIASRAMAMLYVNELASAGAAFARWRR